MLDWFHKDKDICLQRGDSGKCQAAVTKVHCLRLFFHLRLLELSPPPRHGPGTLLSLGYFDALFIIVCSLYPCAMTKETASLVSVNTVNAETQQPQNLINKQGLCNKRDNFSCCYRHIEGTGQSNSLPNTYAMALECTKYWFTCGTNEPVDWMQDMTGRLCSSKL